MSKAKLRMAWTLAGAAALLILSSGLAKLSGSPHVAVGLTQAGFGLTTLGIIELSFSLLFLVPKTSKIGFLFATAYFAAALATEIVSGNNILTPALILTAIWIAAFIKNPEIFIPVKPTSKN